MLPPFIIEQIRRREEQQRSDHAAEQPRLDIPVENDRPRATPVDEDRDRGVVVVDLG